MKNANSQSVLARLVEAAGVTTSGALSGVLGVSSQAIYDAKKKNKIPDSWVRVIAEQTGISADWLFFGRGPARFEDVSTVQDVAKLHSMPASISCSRCVKLEAKLEGLESERRDLSTENRQWAAKAEQLLRENGDLREKCATLEERQKHSAPDGDFCKQENVLYNNT